MSGFLGTGGSGVTIGGVQLYGFEVPDTINWGTKQLTKEQVYPGGRNNIQTMGPANRPMSWRGQMFGPDASDRARLLDQIAAAGKPVELTFGDFNFHVVISFEAAYKHQWQGSYTIECVVQWDYGQAPAAIPPGLSSQGDLQAAVLQGINNALSLSLALAAVVSANLGPNAPGTLIAAGGLIAAGLAGVGASAAASGAILAGSAASPANIGLLVGAAGNTAACAAAWAYTSRAASTWTQVPGISTPNQPGSVISPDLTNYPGA